MKKTAAIAIAGLLAVAGLTALALYAKMRMDTTDAVWQVTLRLESTLKHEEGGSMISYPEAAMRAREQIDYAETAALGMRASGQTDAASYVAAVQDMLRSSVERYRTHAVMSHRTEEAKRLREGDPGLATLTAVINGLEQSIEEYRDAVGASILALDALAEARIRVVGRVGDGAVIPATALDGLKAKLEKELGG